MPWNGQKGYGPWNALADILGAYIQKRAIDGANDYASKAFQNEPMTQAQQDLENSQAEAQHAKIVKESQARQLQQQMNNGFQTNVMDSLKPNLRSGTDILADASGANGGPSMMQMMNDFAKKNNPYATQPTDKISVSMGDGTRIEPKTAMEEAQDQQRIEQAQQKVESPLSYGDYVAQMKNQRSVAMKEMVRKYGIEAAKQAQGLIDDAYNEKISAYADKINNVGMKQLYGSLYGQTEDGQLVRKDLADRNNRINFLFNLQNYNNQAKRMGQSGFDMNIAKELLATDAVKNIQIDDGGNIHVYGQRTDGSMQEMGVISKKLNPGQRVAADLNERKFQYQQKHDAEKLAWDQYKYTHPQQRGGSGRGGNDTKARKWADTLQVGQEAALAAIRSGSTYDNEDDHSVEEFRQNCIKALESGELDEQDKDAVRHMMNGVMGLYQEGLDRR